MQGQGYPPVSTLRLLEIPFTFSQVPLLNSRQFRSSAERWGHRIDEVCLQELNRFGLLVPFFRVDDDPVRGRVVDVDPVDRGIAVRAARTGQLRDPLAEGQSVWWPHVRPNGSAERWDDGYLYSTWQLLGLHEALVRREYAASRGATLSLLVSLASRERNTHIALAALATRFYPGVVGQLTYADGADEDTLSEARFEVDAAARLAAVSIPAGDLLAAAEDLLRRAHTRDPMSEWWDLIRHSDHSGWFRMRGAALEAIWGRIGAEVLLRAHEELADAGAVDRLPDPTANDRWWMPLADRIERREAATGLDRALSGLGLSPQPRVVVVVEGRTEALHVGALLDGFGIGRSRLVRVVEQGTVNDWPKELARFVAPRLGPDRRRTPSDRERTDRTRCRDGPRRTVGDLRAATGVPTTTPSDRRARG